MAYDIVMDGLPAKSLEETPIALGVPRWGEHQRLGPLLLALDADRDEFVRVPLDPSSPDADPDTRFRVGRYTLATGDLRLYDKGPDGSDFLASLSPDDRHIATLAAVSLIEVTTGHRHRIWTGPPAGWGNESAIRWSPDGALIALAYDKWIDEYDDLYHATAIIEPDGTLIRDIDDVTIPQSNGAWLTDTELLVVDTHRETRPAENLAVIDARTGSRRTVGGTSILLINAVLGDRLIRPDGSRSNGYRLSSYRLDGTDPQPFITPPGYTTSFDLAPTLLPPTATSS